MSKHSARGKGWDDQRRRVLNRDGWICTACGRHLEGDDATVDHVDPIAHNTGKTYRDDELVSLCRVCNGRKQDRLLIRHDWWNPRWITPV